MVAILKRSIHLLRGDRSVTQILFPRYEIFARKSSPIRLAIVAGIMVLLFTLLGTVFPVGGLIGFDWVHFWEKGIVPVFYPPWDIYLVNLLSWPLLIGVTLSGISLASILRGRHLISTALVLFCLPVWWTLYLGQLEGIVVFGLLGLPWLTPLALVKPEVSIFAFGARRFYLFGLIAFLLISFLIWGAWPINTLSVESFYAEGRYPQNIGLGLWGLPITLVTLWWSRGDMDMLMASGVFMLPHLIPYNLLPLVPAVARLSPKAALLAGIFSWLPLSANWLGPKGWWLGWIFVAWVWLNLMAQRYPDFRFNKWLRMVVT